MKRVFNLALLDRYILNRLIPNLVFSLFISIVVCEIVGISFEQIKFVAMEGLPVNIAVKVHFFKLPAFICQALPLSLLISTITIYSRLSAENEIVALQSFGVGLRRLVTPVIAIALAVSIFMFALHELVVPVANYQAAMVLERQWQVDRTQLAKYNKREIIYRKFSADLDRSSLEFLFFADRFDGKQMQGITLLKYRQQYLREIVTSRTAQWHENKQLWQLFDGHQDILNKDGSFAQNKDFKQLWIKLDKDILDYANNHQDLREMNLLELYRRLNIIKYTNNDRKIHELRISIAERYASPFSCIVFAFLGSILGTNTKKSQSNSLGIAAIIIIFYYFIQIITTALIFSKTIPVLIGVWFPNLACLFLLRFRSYLQ